MTRFLFLVLTLSLFTAIGCDSPSPSSPIESDSATSVESAAVVAKAETKLPLRRLADLPQPAVLTDEDWPQYRGTYRDGISRAQGLARSWPADGPRVVWETAVGQGYSSPAVVAGLVYIEDYNEERSEWIIRCIELNTGKEKWTYRVKKRIRPNHGITRSVPASDGGYVIAIDPKCEVHCLDARNGDLLWKKLLPAEYGGQIPPWYSGQCPLIDGDRVVLATGGRSIMVALSKATGEPVWETQNPDQFVLTHASIMPQEIDGVRQYTYITMQGAVGVARETGELLWHFPWKFNTAVCTTPLPLGEGKLLLTSGYHAQTVICQVKKDGDSWKAEEVVSLPPPTAGWNSEVHTPILYRDHIFGVGKKQRGLWTCLDLQGNELWTSARQASFELGGYTFADGMFFVLEGSSGVMRVLDAGAEEYKELASFQLLKGPDVWAPPVISHGRLLIRDMGKLACIDISGDQANVAASETDTSSQTR